MKGLQGGLKELKIYKKGEQKMKKVLSLVLALTAMTSMTAFANEDILLISERPATEVTEYIRTPEYVTSYGDITEVTENYILVKTADGEEIQFNKDANTQVIDANTVLPLDLTARETDKVAVTHSTAMTRSIPAQSYAYVIIGNIKSDICNPIFTYVEEVKQNEDGIVIVTENGNKEITVPASADVSPYLTRNIVTLEDIKANSNVLLWYDAVTLSIPAYAVSERAVVFAGNIFETVEEESSNGLVVNGVEITLADDEIVYNNNGVEMLPLRTVAETLGFTVEWVEETQSIVVSKGGAFSTTVRIGEERYGLNKAIMILDSAPILYNNEKTYVPVSFFDAIANIK